MQTQTIASTARPSGALLAAVQTTPDAATMRAAAHSLGIDSDVTEAAIAALHQGAVAAVFSGKMASGKDTVAEHCSAGLAARNLTPAVVHRTSDPIRAELNWAIDVVASQSELPRAVEALRTEMDLPPHVAAHLAESYFEPTRWTLPRAEERTNLNRHCLQYIADEGRRSVDPGYWVKRCFATLYQTLADGHSAFLSGGRYPNEILPAQVLGMVAIRIEVSRDIQEHRLSARDGVAPDQALLNNENECALDNFIGFNLVVGNDDGIEPTVELVLTALSDHAHRLGR